MKKIIKVKSLPLADVISDLAEAFGTTYTQHCNRYVVQIPDDWGIGSIDGINFPSGLGLLHYDCLFHQDLEIQFNVDKTHPLKFLFCLKGKITHSFENDTTLHEVATYKNVIVASSSHIGHILRFNKEAHTVLSSLEVDRMKYVQHAWCELTTMNFGLKNLFMDTTAASTFFHDGHYSLTMSKLFEDRLPLQSNLVMERMFLEGKSYQVLAEQIRQYEDDIKLDGSQSLLRQSDIEKVLEAEKIIRRDLSSVETIPRLADKVGLNKAKLQSGFQELFGLSVNEFIMKTRIEVAATLLTETNLTISEIMYKIGLNSRSYISKVFKDTYGVSPKTYRKNLKRTVPMKQVPDSDPEITSYE